MLLTRVAILRISYFDRWIVIRLSDHKGFDIDTREFSEDSVTMFDNSEHAKIACGVRGFEIEHIDK